jgi:hypothetical protein
MTKADLQMTNHELQARVIELENELKREQIKGGQRQEIINSLTADAAVDREDYKTVTEQLSLADAHMRDLENTLEQVALLQPPEPFTDWYKRLHPRGPGSDPDLAVVRQSQYAKIIA